MPAAFLSSAKYGSASTPFVQQLRRRRAFPAASAVSTGPTDPQPTAACLPSEGCVLLVCWQLVHGPHLILGQARPAARLAWRCAAGRGRGDALPRHRERQLNRCHQLPVRAADCLRALRRLQPASLKDCVWFETVLGSTRRSIATTEIAFIISERLRVFTDERHPGRVYLLHLRRPAVGSGSNAAPRGLHTAVDGAHLNIL